MRTYLVALVLACLLPGILGAGALFLYQYREGRAQLELNTLHTARALVQAIDNHLSKVEAIAQALAASETLRYRDFATFHRKAQEIVAVGGLTPGIVLWGRNGHRLIDTSVDFGQDLPRLEQSAHVERVFESGRPQISEVFMSGAMEQPVVSVTAPVLIDKQAKYALSLSISPRYISDILLMQSLPPGWVATALDPNGIIFGRNTDLDRFVGKRAPPELFESLSAAGESVLERNAEGSMPMLTFHSRSPITGWGVAIGIPREELEAGLRRRLSLLAAGMAVLFAAGFLLTWMMGGRIAASMRMLAEAATALGRSEPAPKVSTTIREAEEVGMAIHSASQLLQARSTALKAREAELKEAHQLGKFGTWFWNLQTGEIHNSESVAWIFGRSLPPFSEQRGTLLTEESWDRVAAALQQVLKTGKGFDLELQGNHGNGYLIWISVKSEVIRDDSDEIVGLMGTVQDITERKRYEDALRASETAARDAAYLAEAERRRLAAVLEATPVGVIVGNAQGFIIEANAASKQLWGRHTHISQEEATQGDWKGWWADGSERHGQALQRQDWPMARALRGEEATRDIIEIAPFGEMHDERRIVMMSGAVIRDAAGSIIGGVVAQMDITDRIRTEEALRDAGQRKDEFLAMLAHELRNPLAPISAAADLLQMTVKDKDEQASCVPQASAIIARQVRHMASLIEDLLDVSRVTRGLITLDKQPTDLNRVLSDAVEQVKPLMETRGHELTISPFEPALVLGDYNRLVQTVTNLLNNAAKFTLQPGRISVGIQEQGACLRIDVTDNGMGMSAEVLRRAFDMFAQGERTSDRSQGGLGIGLALVKSLVELHGGQVVAHSDGPGKGSRFSVLLLRYLGGQGESVLHQLPPVPAAPAHVLKVMVVDDNVDAAMTLAALVEALGHQVIVEHDARTALARSRTERPQVFLLDIGLPGMDGVELARHLCAQAETEGAMLVAVTGYGQGQQHFTDLGFDHHFTKPVELARLADILGRVMK